MQKLKINDEVIVTAGKSKGRTGTIESIDGKGAGILIKGVNLVKKAIKPTQENPNGGIVDVESPLDRSNVMVVSPKTKKATRVRIEEKDGKNVRVATACGSVLS